MADLMKEGVKAFVPSRNKPLGPGVGYRQAYSLWLRALDWNVLEALLIKLLRRVHSIAPAGPEKTECVNPMHRRDELLAKISDYMRSNLSRNLTFDEISETFYMTWEETFELAGRMTRSDGQKRYYGFGSSGTGALIGWNPFSIPLVDGSKRRPTIQTDERWKTLIQTVFLNPVISQTYKEAWKIPDWASFSKDRNVAMILYTAAAPLALTKDFSTLDWDMVSLPLHPELPTVGSQVSPNYFGVISMSEKKDAAMEAVKFCRPQPPKRMVIKQMAVVRGLFGFPILCA
ncbi:hypothetical protein FE784_38380 [Paenibacillus hemerocallicola]|uniref:Extracellular solute-binding protein n=1 Tax=Paenibacillus hemerocallicola TaxID=1172614 RepID=A0A5C4SYA7_9BACL|nr:hypothetical protein [Paenibacillus hemerocallicola]TNJ57743.1 hypothetical protein FE784_38380 [Paenibacillus hemerocallicola]